MFTVISVTNYVTNTYVASCMLFITYELTKQLMFHDNVGSVLVLYTCTNYYYEYY